MSVTFYLNGGTPETFRVHMYGCGDMQYADQFGNDFPDAGAATAALLAHADDCVLCRHTDGTVGTVDPVEPSVNMANGNALAVLTALGLYDTRIDPADAWEDACVGEASPDEMKGRVVLALGLTDADPGTPTRMVRARGGATVIDCGRAAGYLQARLHDLLNLAEQGRTQPGTTIHWS